MNVKNTEGLIKHARDLSNLTVSSNKRGDAHPA